MLVMTACAPGVSGSAEPTVADTKAVKESDTRMIETAKGKVEVPLYFSRSNRRLCRRYCHDRRMEGGSHGPGRE